MNIDGNYRLIISSSVEKEKKEKDRFPVEEIYWMTEAERHCFRLLGEALWFRLIQKLNNEIIKNEKLVSVINCSTEERIITVRYDNV